MVASRARLFVSAVVLVAACGGNTAAAEQTAALQAAISRMEGTLSALDERLAQIEARAEASAKAAQPAPLGTATTPEGLAHAAAVAVERIEAPAKPGSRVEVVVTREGLEVDGKPQTLEELQTLLAAAADRYDVTVQIQTDPSVDHGRIVEVLESTRAAGIERLAIASQAEPPAFP